MSADSVDSGVLEFFDRRPIIMAIAGPNGAGKTTFYNAYLKRSGLRFLNADVLVREMYLADYEGAQFAAALRKVLVEQRESFIFETVFSDPVGDKLQFLKHASELGYAVVLCFIGLESARQSEERVNMRVSQGGHDVPREKLVVRFPRTLANLKAAICGLPVVLIFDNSDLRNPFRYIAAFEKGTPVALKKPVPRWFRNVLSSMR